MNLTTAKKILKERQGYTVVPSSVPKLYDILFEGEVYYQYQTARQVIKLGKLWTNDNHYKEDGWNWD